MDVGRGMDITLLLQGLLRVFTSGGFVFRGDENEVKSMRDF